MTDLEATPGRTARGQRERKQHGERIGLVCIAVVVVGAVIFGVKTRLYPAPPRLPAWVPGLPHGRCNEVRAGPEPASSLGGVFCETDAAPEVVVRGYEDALRAAGFYVTHEASPPGRRALVAYRCDLGQLINVSASATGTGVTSVSLSYRDTGPVRAATAGTADARLPAWVPAYPGARMVADQARTDERRGYGSAVFLTPDDAHRVCEFYREAARAHGLVPTGGLPTRDSSPGEALDTASPDGRLHLRVETEGRPLEACRQRVVVSWQDWPMR